MSFRGLSSHQCEDAQCHFMSSPLLPVNGSSHFGCNHPTRMTNMDIGCVFENMQDCLVKPNKGFICSTCGFTGRLCIHCLNERWCPQCLRTGIPVGDAHSENSEEENAEDAMIMSTSGCIFQKMHDCLVMPNKLFVCSGCRFSCRMCVWCLNHRWCPQCHRTDIPLGDAQSEEENVEADEPRQ